MAVQVIRVGTWSVAAAVPVGTAAAVLRPALATLVAATPAMHTEAVQVRGPLATRLLTAGSHLASLPVDTRVVCTWERRYLRAHFQGALVVWVLVVWAAVAASAAILGL